MEIKYFAFDGQNFDTSEECLDYENAKKTLINNSSLYWIAGGKLKSNQTDSLKYISLADYIYLPDKDSVKAFRLIILHDYKPGLFSSILTDHIKDPGIYYKSINSTSQLTYIPIKEEIHQSECHLKELKSIVKLFKDMENHNENN